MRKAKPSKHGLNRSLAALHQGCASVTKKLLPRDILAIIIDFLEATSPKSLINLGITDSVFYNLTKASRQRQLVIDLTTTKHTALVQRCTRIESEGLLSAIRSLIIVDDEPIPPKSADNRQTCLETTRRLLPLMTGLRTITYRSDSVPDEILIALEQLPHLKLCAKVRAFGHIVRQALPKENQFRLCGNINLHTLDVKVRCYQPIDYPNIIPPLRRLLTSCPNLRRLSLDIARPQNEFRDFVPLKDCHGLCFGDGDNLPPLEQFSLTSDPFGPQPNIVGHDIDFNSRGLPMNGAEADFWVEKCDWSRLTSLQAYDRDFVLKLMPKLIALEDFEFIATWLGQEGSSMDVSTFCILVPASLRRISAPTVKSVALDGILRHANSLQELHLHQCESNQAGWGEDAMDLTSLQSIQEDCRLISHLTLDLPRFEDWPYSMFDVLATFPELRTLDLWFEQGITIPNVPIKPLVTPSSTEHIFKYIRSRSSRAGGSVLRRLILHTIFSPPPEGRFPRPSLTTFLCQLSERDDEAAAGVYEVKQGWLPRDGTAFSCGLSKHDDDVAAGVYVVPSNPNLSRTVGIAAKKLGGRLQSYRRRIKQKIG